MAYRKKRTNHAKLKVWKNWVSQNHFHLESIGLPLAIYQDIRSLGRFSGKWTLALAYRRPTV